MLHSPIHLTIHRGTVEQTGTAAELLLLLNLEAPLTVTTENGPRCLGAEDLLLLSPKSRFRLQGSGVLCVQFALDAERFRECFPQKRYRFRCDSTQEVSDNYPLLRRLLAQVLAAYYEQHTCLEAELNRLYYELLLFLVHHFAVEESAGPGSFAQQAADYIERHFREDLSLQQISETFHMSPQYFSRKFKAQLGQTYYHYLSGVRLSHAEQDLAGTENTLLHIALDNGFPNMESFHRYFVASYGQTPLDYRAACQSQRQRAAQENHRALEDALRHLAPSAQPAAPDRPPLQIPSDGRRPYHPYWRELLHLGSAALLDDNLIAEQVRVLQDTMHFHFVRIQADCSGFAFAQDYSFYAEERRLDYLVDQGLVLWFYVDYRSVTDWDRMCAYLDRLFSHFANRYSIGNIKRWRLELVYNTLFDAPKAAAYWRCYQRLQGLLYKYGCTEPLLGPGLALGAEEGIRNFYAYLDAHGLTLAEQTFEAEPYLCVQTEGGPTITRATDTSYLRNKLLTLQQNLPYFRDTVQKVYITSWTDSLLKTSVMNDSCYMGAHLLKTMLDCFGQVQAVANVAPLDAVYTGNLQGDILFGGSGLLTKHGIPKPSYYAYALINRVGESFICKDENSIVFADKEDNYQILCHNCKRLNYKYYLAEEKADPRALSQYFEDLDPCTLSYRICGLKNGRYIIKQRTVSTDGGSVQDRLLEMGAGRGVYVHPNDLAYLRQVSVPHIHLQEAVVTDETLELQCTLSANSFALIHIIYQY